MRQKVSKEKLHRFMNEVARRTQGEGKVYFTGGATALLLGFRDQTVDVDIKIDPEPRGIFEAIASLKSELSLNIELASPDDFIPSSKLWRERALWIDTIRGVSFYHYDLAMQALAKIERGFHQDLSDAAALIAQGHITLEDVEERLNEIETLLIRYPAVDAEEFRSKVSAFIARQREGR